MISKVKQNRSETLIEDISKLILLSERNKNIPLVRQMKKIVLEYKSENSQYEKLDLMDNSAPLFSVTYNENNLNSVFQ